MKIGYVEKHGGMFGAPCFEIFNANGVTTFILENSTKKESNSATMEYEVTLKNSTYYVYLMQHFDSYWNHIIIMYKLLTHPLPASK